MSMRQFEAVIFDLDGVIVDTAKFHYLGWKRLADELGIPFDQAKNERMKGVSRMESLRILLEGSAKAWGDPEVLADRKNAYYRVMVEKMTPSDVFPGVIELLRKLRTMGIKVGVASSSRNAGAVIGKLGIAPLLDTVVGGNDCLRPKPAPDLFLLCAVRLEAAPQKCVVVEDAQAGIDAAKAAGMYAVGVGTPELLSGWDALIAGTGDFSLDMLL